jgi:endonuclease/exonuclease/phosphatase family metal-dependent hydrolase
MPLLPMLFAVMTYNVNYANPDTAGSMDAIATADADVVLLQEVTPAWQAVLEKRFAKLYPHRAFHAAGVGGMAVLSKHEITAEELWLHPKGGFSPAQRLVVESPIGTIQIVNVHLRANIDKGSWVIGWTTTPAIRLREIETYWKKLATMPTIIAGDFNELPDAKAIQFLAGKGLVRIATTGPKTWHHVVEVRGKKRDGLSADIDHVIVDKSFTASDPHVVDAGASDHRPVVVTLERASR